MEAFDRKECTRRILLARMRITNKSGFYGLLLMHAHFAIDVRLETAATDGEKIFFSPAFLTELSDSELDFVLMHEIMHVALKHCFRRDDRDNDLFNIACDIVVNSNILKSCGMDINSITLKSYGESMHLAPNGKEGYLYTAEQVYKMLLKKVKEEGSGEGEKGAAGGGADGESDGNGGGAGLKKNATVGNKRKGGTKCETDRSGGGLQKEKVDSHDRWGDGDPTSAAEWEKRVADAAEAQICRGASTVNVPLGVERILKELKRPTVDWRTVLVDFIQEEVCDYSFSPPDRRFDTDFFLPDFNDKCDKIKNILFMIDTSASMSPKMLATVYSEVYGALVQFNGNIEGKLGFFDAEVVEPVPFSGEEEFKMIKPKGGGGTSFKAIFDYIKENMQDEPPDTVVILTDGYAEFPDEKATLGIPTLWIITYVDYRQTDEKIKPPFGKVVYIPRE